MRNASLVRVYNSQCFPLGICWPSAFRRSGSERNKKKKKGIRLALMKRVVEKIEWRVGRYESYGLVLCLPTFGFGF